MKISVNKYTLEPRTIDGGTAGSHGLECLEFDFSPEWNGLYRTVTFFPPKSVAKCVSFTGNSVPLPPEATARAGKTAFVLCGAKDGAAIITLSGVIEVAETLLPTEAQASEHTPGAMEQLTLLCAEARTDALSAASAAESALGAEAAVAELAKEVEKDRKVVSDLYDEVIDGTAVHERITTANCLDLTHPVSVAGINEHLDALLATLSPLKIKVVDILPDKGDQDCIYLAFGKEMVYATPDSYVKVYRWTPTYLASNGPAVLYTYKDYFEEGMDVYWSAEEVPLSTDALQFYTSVNAVNGSDVVTDESVFNADLIDYVDAVTSKDQYWRELSSQDDLTQYLQDSPVRRLITGGTA